MSHFAAFQFAQTNVSVRRLFAAMYESAERASELDSVDTLEILGASFRCMDDTIFGEPDQEYIKREIEWYNSQSLSVHDFPGGAPTIWKKVADHGGDIVSNYGNLLFGKENYQQFQYVIDELTRDRGSRRAIAIYTRPEMWTHYGELDLSDFICTNAVHYEIRGDRLHVVVQMRSNDAIFGFRNDYAWQVYVQNQLLHDLRDAYPDLKRGEIVWQAASLHVYPRHFHLIKHYIDTGEYRTSVRKGS